MVVWRVRGKIIRSVLYRIVSNNKLYCAQCNAHTHMNRPNGCLLVRFSFSVVYCVLQFICVRFSFLGLFCVIVCLCMCAFVVLDLLDLVSSVPCQEIG